jgi:hypothetical protein
MTDSTRWSKMVKGSSFLTEFAIAPSRICCAAHGDLICTIMEIMAADGQCSDNKLME